MLRTLITIVLLLGAAAANAQDLLTLEQALQTGLQNNYNVRIAKNDASIATNNVTPGNAGFLPSVDAYADITQSINNSNQQYLSGQEVEKTGAKNTTGAAGVGLTWTLFDGFSMFVSHDQLKLSEENGQALLKQQIENTMSLIIAAYYDVLLEQYLLSALNEQREISLFRKELLDTRLSVGSASKIELLKATVDLNADQTAVIQQEAEVQKIKVRLNQLLARDVNIDFSVDTTVQWNATLVYDQLRQDLLAHNSDLLISNQYLRLAALNMKQTTAKRYPEIGVITGYDFLQSSSESGFVSSNRTNGFYYGLTASINIFDGFNVNRQHQNDKINLATSQLEVEQTQLSLESELKRIYLDYQNNLRLVDLEKSNLKYAEENLTIAQESYQIGRLSDLELREIQKNLVDAKVRLAEATFRAKIQETDLMRITGNLLKS
ncbi:MAG TPA: TolC family protein [Chitinophagales bacterium]|nr:TolC family protein [Chitinophagales bacterium]